MAKMYSRKRGHAGSKRPSKRAISSWVRYKDKEVELLITKLAKEGKTSSQIGIILRDAYGIPDIKTLMKKNVTAVLKEKGLLKEIPEDVVALIKRSIYIRKHIEANKKDEAAKRGLNITESKIKKLVKYYKKSRRLPESWTYDPSSIKLYLE